eukprot:6460869-Prymnesium_polylepis.1
MRVLRILVAARAADVVLQDRQSVLRRQERQADCELDARVRVRAVGAEGLELLDVREILLERLDGELEGGESRGAVLLAVRRCAQRGSTPGRGDQMGG